ncbi:MAG: glycosyltransferase [Desulfurococcaceae archaeon]
MHVVFVSRMPPVACGIAEYSSMLLTELVKLPGLSVIALGGDMIEYPLGYTYKDVYSGISVKNCFKGGDLSYVDNCLENQDRLDVVHIQHELGIFPDAIALASFMKNVKSRGVKLVLTMHTVIHALGGENLVGIQRLLTGNSDAVVVHSVIQEQELLRQGTPPEKIYMIPHGTLINPYLKEPRSRLLEELPLPRDVENKKLVSVIGFVRSRDKDYIQVIKAVDTLAQRYDVKLVVAGMPRRKDAGDVLLEEKIEQVARKGGNVYFLEGFLDRALLLKLLAVSDIVTIPIVEQRSYPISVSGVFHLAIGSRKPVICTRAHKLVECNLLAPELTLRVFTVEYLVKKLEEVLEESEGVKRAINRLWNYALEKRWDVIARKHYELYRELVPER